MGQPMGGGERSAVENRPLHGPKQHAAHHGLHEERPPDRREVGRGGPVDQHAAVPARSQKQKKQHHRYHKPYQYIEDHLYPVQEEG
jgi:hypothetical protein